MNQFSLDLQPSDTLWYTPMEHHHHHQPPPQQKSYPFFYQNYDDADSDNSSSNANNADRSETTSSTTTATLDKEHMFEKPLTPSDVGKLNRLVIPKQHAEKYFPLAAATAAAANDSTTVAGGSGTGGLLLGFEDEAGKCWRFRYSYWNSSQSYVLTKGWSRYVKEKRLDAGDVVLFERHRFDSDRFFIGWRRRGSNPPVQPSAGWTARSSSSSYNFNQNHGNYHQNQNVVQSQQNYAASHQISAFPNYPHHHPESPHAGTVQVRQKAKKSGGVNSKRVRLFGVNLECELEDEDQQVVDDEPSRQTSDGSSLSSQGGQGHGLGSNSATMGHHTTSYNYFDYMGYPQLGLGNGAGRGGPGSFSNGAGQERVNSSFKRSGAGQERVNSSFKRSGAGQGST